MSVVLTKPLIFTPPVIAGPFWFNQFFTAGSIAGRLWHSDFTKRHAPDLSITSFSEARYIYMRSGTTDPATEPNS